MSLHHIGDEVAALRALRGLLAPHGLLGIAEMWEPLRVLPDGLGVGRPGLADRLERAGRDWFAAIRDGLPDAVPSADLPSMVTAAGLQVVDSRLTRIDIPTPVPDDARRVALAHVRRTRHWLAGYLDDDDCAALDVLGDDHDPRSVRHRPDVFVAASRQLVIARPASGRALSQALRRSAAQDESLPRP